MIDWPAARRLQTRKILDGIDPFPIGGILMMKSICNFSAYLKQADLHNGQIILYDSETQLITCFQSAGELFDAGWIADLAPALTLNIEEAEPEKRHRTVNPEATRVVPLMICKEKDRA